MPQQPIIRMSPQGALDDLRHGAADQLCGNRFFYVNANAAIVIKRIAHHSSPHRSG